jgi:hypothetical protein
MLPMLGGACPAVQPPQRYGWSAVASAKAEALAKAGDGRRAIALSCQRASRGSFCFYTCSSPCHFLKRSTSSDDATAQAAPAACAARWMSERARRAALTDLACQGRRPRGCDVEGLLIGRGRNPGGITSVAADGACVILETFEERARRG